MATPSLLDRVKNIGKEGKKIGQEAIASAKSAVEKLVGGTAFLVERFATTEDLQERLNTLQVEVSKVNVAAMCEDSEGYLIAIIKLED